MGLIAIVAFCGSLGGEIQRDKCIYVDAQDAHETLPECSMKTVEIVSNPMIILSSTMLLYQTYGVQNEPLQYVTWCIESHERKSFFAHHGISTKDFDI